MFKIDGASDGNISVAEWKRWNDTWIRGFIALTLNQRQEIQIGTMTMANKRVFSLMNYARQTLNETETLLLRHNSQFIRAIIPFSRCRGNRDSNIVLKFKILISVKIFFWVISLLLSINVILGNIIFSRVSIWWINVSYLILVLLKIIVEKKIFWEIVIKISDNI